MDFEIREALPSDAEQILLNAKICGGETDNLSYGKEGFSYTLSLCSWPVNLLLPDGTISR